MSSSPASGQDIIIEDTIMSQQENLTQKLKLTFSSADKSHDNTARLKS